MSAVKQMRNVLEECRLIFLSRGCDALVERIDGAMTTADEHLRVSTNKRKREGRWVPLLNGLQVEVMDEGWWKSGAGSDLLVILSRIRMTPSPQRVTELLTDIIGLTQYLHLSRDNIRTSVSLGRIHGRPFVRITCPEWEVNSAHSEAQTGSTPYVPMG